MEEGAAPSLRRGGRWEEPEYRERERAGSRLERGSVVSRQIQVLLLFIFSNFLSPLPGKSCALSQLLLSYSGNQFLHHYDFEVINIFSQAGQYRLDPNSCLQISVVGLEKGSNSPCLVGTAVVPLFHMVEVMEWLG